MAADPGCSGEAAAYHLFLTRIPPRLPKEEVEAAVAKDLASRGVIAESVSVVPQSAWKTKGYGFITLAGSPTPEAVLELAALLDNQLRVGGRPINVRVCQPSASGASQVAPAPERPVNWDQPAEKISRLCAQVLHCYFARRVHQSAFKAEKLLALLSMTVAPSRGQEPKPLALWGREVYGSLEQMLLAIGEAHFGASAWSLTGAVAERDAVLTVAKARHMQGWDPLRDPLPIATLLRLAACKTRLDDVHTPQSAHSGFSTPTCSTTHDSCRRCSDCGSLSAVHSSEQPSCSQSEASWSLRSLYVAAAAGGGEQAGSECTPSLDGMPSSGSDDPALSTSSPASCASYDSLRSCGGSGHVDSGQKPAQEPEPPPMAQRLPASAGPAPAGAASAASAAAAGSGASDSAGEGRQVDDAAASSSGRQHAPALQTQQQQQQQRRRTTRTHLAGASCPHLPAHHQAAQGLFQHAPWMPRSAMVFSVHPCAAPSLPAVPPSARDLLHRCATHLQLLFQWHPAQLTFALPYLAEFLSSAPDVVAWGAGSTFFSLEGYAGAVYGSFEGLLLQVSRSYFGGCWQIEGARQPGEPRVLCVPRCSHNMDVRSHHHPHPHHHHQLQHQQPYATASAAVSAKQQQQHRKAGLAPAKAGGSKLQRHSSMVVGNSSSSVRL